MTLSASQVTALYQSLPSGAREFIEHGSDWKTINDVLVEKYYNDPELGRDAFGAIGDLTAGLAVDLLLAGTPTGWIAGLIYGVIAGEFGDAAGKAAWDILTSKEWQDFTDPAKNVDWGKLVNPDGYDVCNNGTHLLPGICDKSNTDYLRARNFVRRDPLAIDLDGDGIETVGVNAGVLFDHNADAIKTGTGWLKADDAFVVLDRDGNGTIDSGRELFGVDTIVGTEPLTGRTLYASDGFAALKSLDANGDSLFNSADAQYASVRLWRDLNQDGISQTAELQDLATAGITALDLATRKATRTLPGGNTQTLTAAVAGLGENAAVSLNLAHNPFYREFPDHLDTTSVASLPDMAGSGMVRDLQEAATLSSGLATQLATLQGGWRSRQQFDSELDALLDAWAATSTLTTSAQNTIYYKTSTTGGVSFSSGGGGGYTPPPTDPASLELMRRITVLECFNGQAFVTRDPVTGAIVTGNGITTTPGATTNGSGGGGIPGGTAVLSLTADQTRLINESYDALKESVRDGLALQTRLKGYLDAIVLQVDANGVRLDFTAVDALLASRRATDAQAAYGDLADLMRGQGGMLMKMGWIGAATKVSRGGTPANGMWKLAA